MVAHHVRTGRLLRIAHGYVMAVPDDALPGWVPGIETQAAGIAAAIYGQGDVSLVGMTAARIHGAYPRAVAEATVAVPRQHRPIALTVGGTVRFITRDISRIDVRRERLETGQALVTTPEQTALDLARYPNLATDEQAATEAIRNLMPQIDRTRLERIASRQPRMSRALSTVKELEG